jgi:hypothetical protein
LSRPSSARGPDLINILTQEERGREINKPQIKIKINVKHFFITSGFMPQTGRGAFLLFFALDMYAALRHFGHDQHQFLSDSADL